MKQLFIESASVLGSGQVLSQWDCRNKYLAVVGGNHRVRIYNRSGSVVNEFALTSRNRVTYLDWDTDGETLAVAQENEAIIVLYDISIRKLTKLNTDLKKITFLSWNKGKNNDANILSIGSSKGNLLLYNKLSFRKQCIMGKHSKKILYGAWNEANKLALVGKDKKLTLSDVSGSTLNESYLKQYPLDLQFGLQMSDNKKDGVIEDTITMNMNGKTIYMYFLNAPSQPIELAFQQKYGDIICYKWYGDGYILAGFSKGFIVSISTHEKEMGEEINSLRIDHKSIVSLQISSQFAAVSTANCIKIIDLQSWKENDHFTVDFDADYGVPKILNWSSDGQILCVNTSSGYLLAYLFQTSSSSQDIQVYEDLNIAFLSSLQQISVVLNYTKDANKKKLKIEVTVEPKLIAIGQNALCITFNNHLWCYSFANVLIFEYDFISEIQCIKMNASHVALLVDGKIFLIDIEKTKNKKDKIKPFVFGVKNEKICTFSLTPFFLICASKNGILYQIFLENYKSVNETKHKFIDNNDSNNNGKERQKEDAVIRSVFPNHNGTLSVFIDCSNYGFLYNPVTDTKLNINKFAPTICKIFWDKTNRHVFYGYDASKHSMFTFVYNAQTLKGPVVEYIDVSTLPQSFLPIVVINGIVIGYNSKNFDKIEHKILNCYESLYESFMMKQKMGKNVKISELISISQFSQTRKCFYQLMALHFVQYAYFISLRLNQRELWIALSKKCLELLNIKLAISVFRSLQNASAVLLLQKIQNEDDLFLVSGHCCTLLNDFDFAQKLFLLSREPIWALKMRRNLLQFDIALGLSEKIAPNLTESICFEYAQQLEFKQKYADSLKMYQRAGNRQQCTSGIVRCTLRIGHIQKGVELAQSSKDKALIYECANLLQSMKQFEDAANLYIECGEIAKAVKMFIAAKKFEAVQPLISQITTPSLHCKYAKEMELIKKYDAALESYKIANDKVSVLRLYLYHLNDIDTAINMVRNDPFIEGAKMISIFTLNKRDIVTSIEFLVISKNFCKAFDLASSNNEIDAYAQFLDQYNEYQQFEEIAAFYLNNNDFGNAAKCYLKASLFEEALINFVKAGIGEHLDDILQIVRECNDDDKIIQIILDQLQTQSAESSNKNMDKIAQFKLYLAIGDIEFATKMALEICAQKQRMGQYREAHNILFEIVRELKERRMSVAKELSSNLMLLHSYLLVKQLIQKRHNHLAAKMLIRASESISKFPSHTVPILTSTVIQCTKTGLHSHAIEYANFLMRNEYRKQIMPKYKKKIESIVRHSYKQQKQQRGNEESGRREETEREKMSECPYCTKEIAAIALYCDFCKRQIPFCIVTGQHMLANDWTHCPECSFPALHSELVQHANNGLDCTMCKRQIDPQQIKLCQNPLS